MAQPKTDSKPTLRQTRKQRHEQRRTRQRAITRLTAVVAGFATLALLGYVIWGLMRPKLGQAVAQQARTHIELGDPHEPYNSDPPTSGPHAGTVAAGFYSEAPPDENLVHNLEHGYVIIWYDCSTLEGAQCQGLMGQIEKVMQRARPVVFTTGAKKLIAVPRPGMESRIALTSWGRHYRLDDFDEASVMQFITDFRNQAPEPGAP